MAFCNWQQRASTAAGKVKKSKKGKKKAADMDAVFAALNGDADAAAMDAQTNGLQHEEQADTLAPPGELSHSAGYGVQF